MNAVAIIKLVTFVESLILAVVAARQEAGSRTARAFTRYILLVACASLVEYMLVTSGNEGQFLFWKRLDVLMYPAVAAMLHFSLLLRGYSWVRTPWTARVLYGVFAAIAFIEGMALRPVAVHRAGWSFVSEYPPAFVAIHAVFVIVACVAAASTLLVLWDCMVHARERRSRTQAAVFFWSTVALGVTGMAFEIFPALFREFVTPFSATATTAFLVVNPVLAFAVVRYGILRLNPAAAPDIMDMMSDAVVLLDGQGTVLYANRAATLMAGLRAEPGGPGPALPKVRIMRQGGGVMGYAELRNGGVGLRETECIIEVPGERPMHVALSSSVLREPFWGETGVIVTMRDIAERRKAEQARDSADRLMRHDLRNALTGISGLSGLLAADGSLTAEQRESAEVIQQSARIMNEQIESYLYLRSVEEGSFKAPLVDVELLDVLRSVLNNQQSEARQFSVHAALTVDGRAPRPGEAITVRGIRSMLFGIFLNIVRNAIEASPFGSEVRVTVRTNGGISVAVHNRGAIPREIREHFFERPASSGKSGGMGLGAHGARLMAEALGCTVSFTTDEETGTEIVVAFPSPLDT